MLNPMVAKKMITTVADIHSNQCEYTLQQKDVLAAFRKEKFDIGISEAFDFCGLAIYEEIGITKHVLVSALWETIGDIFGAPNLPAVVPSLMNGVNSKMTYFQRVGNLFTVQISKWWIDTVISGCENAAERVLGRRIDIYEKIAQASFVITNVDPLLDYPRPITEKIVNIGGISVPPPKSLDTFWEKVVMKRKTTVLVSFGSVAQSHTMPEEMKKAILETFKRFPDVTFIWKYEKDEDDVANGYPNVITNKWVPQNDLLNHPNLKLFITHAGMNSISEVSRRGVPVITIPLFGDQIRNAHMVKRLGTAVVVEKTDLTNSNVLEAEIREVLENPSYLTNALRLSHMMAKWPKNQREQFVKYVQFAGEFGHLPEYSIPKVSFTQYYMLDILVPIFIIILAVILLFPYLIYKCLARLLTRKVKTA
ncbi:hypothetical protein L596_026029 [Steinernema carpocapsae]|nr:hypothetical protein L596_026029 [Steinernema carpocapsae]